MEVKGPLPVGAREVSLAEAVAVVAAVAVAAVAVEAAAVAVEAEAEAVAVGAAGSGWLPITRMMSTARGGKDTSFMNITLLRRIR